MAEGGYESRRSDALLAAAQSQEKGVGRLKIYLGAAPGVGKTYEMLQAAQARHRENIDVVVGVVETHGRAETTALVEGLEVLPRKKIDYKGQVIEELDLDALLARRPALALIDELAHTNVPGSRHPKRYLDVEELLAAGIDVYTTLNIQHVESLNDVVAQITRIRVRETVPDRVLDRADEIELLDLTPDELIRRLNEGKVYVAKHAERALRHYFSPGNLTALRELALRRTAQRVDAQLLTHMQSHAIPGPWAAGERVIVCVSEDRRSAGLARHAKRLADYLHAPLMALFVESRRSLEYTDADRDRIAQTMRLVQTLGGEVATVPAASRRIADDVLAFARMSNATQIVVGKSDRSALFELVNGSVVHDLVRRAGNIGIHVVAGDEPGDRLVSARGEGRAPEPRADLAPFLWAGLGIAAALGFAELAQPLIGLESIDLVFLTAVVVVAARFGLWPSLFAVVLSSLAYNFFFLPPLYTFTIADPTNVAALFFFTLVAVLVSNLAARARVQTLAAQTRARTTEALYTFSRKLASCVTIDDVLWVTVYQIASMLRVRVVLLLAEGEALSVQAGYPPDDMLDDADLAAARWAFDNGEAAGRGADTLPGAKRLFQPLRTGRGAIGVVGLDKDGRADADARTGAPFRCARRPERPRDRARPSRRGSRPRQTRRRDGPAPAGAADVDLPRPQDPACRDLVRGNLSARPWRRTVAAGKGGVRRHDHRGIGAAQSLHRQSPRYDKTRIRRDRAASRTSGSRRDRRGRPRAYVADIERPSDRRRYRGGPADAADRRRAVRAGSFQSSRQCRKIFRTGNARAGRGPPPGRDRRNPHPRRRAGRSALRNRAHLRQILSRKADGQRPGRNRPWPCHFAWFHRGHGWYDHRREPQRPDRGGLHPDPACRRFRKTASRTIMSSSQPTILVVDDEPPIRKLLRTGLGTQGYKILDATNGKTALQALRDEKPDLVILDLGLPDVKGHELLRTIRERYEDIPVIVLSARDDEFGKVQALDTGADDYVTKPFGMNELLARIRTALRHRLHTQGERPIFRSGDLSVDLVRRIVMMGDREIKLSRKEYDMLRHFVHHAGKVLTHSNLLRELWPGSQDAQYLRVYVRQLRQKIEPDPERPRYILTETGVGYRLRPPDPERT